MSEHTGKRGKRQVPPMLKRCPVFFFWKNTHIIIIITIIIVIFIYQL